jgi:hypothetical protein
MWYTFIRIIFWVIIIIISLSLIKKLRFHRKRIYITLIIIIALLSSISYLLPFENLFITFHTPQELFKFVYYGKIMDIIEGNDSCLIVYITNQNTYSTTIILKVRGGYKIGSSLFKKKLTAKHFMLNYFSIYNYTQSTDNYVIGAGIVEDNNFVVSDSNDSVIKYFINDVGTINKTVFWYGYIGEMKDNYAISINGNKIIIK